MSSDYNSISQFFSHPLVLLLIGAAISGVLIPYFTNRAARYQKGLEIKTDLVRRINESTMRLVNALRVWSNELLYAKIYLSDKRPTGNYGLHSRKKELEDELEEIEKQSNQSDQDELAKTMNTVLGTDKKQKEVSKELEATDKCIQNVENSYGEADKEYRQWHLSSAVIGSEIRYYFPEFGEKREGHLPWSAFEDFVEKAFGHAADVYNKILLSGPLGGIDEIEIDDLLNKKAQIIAQIRDSSVSGLSEHLFSRLIRKFTRR